VACQQHEGYVLSHTNYNDSNAHVRTSAEPYVDANDYTCGILFHRSIRASLICTIMLRLSTPYMLQVLRHLKFSRL
jgi:hypothetical protein